MVVRGIGERKRNCSGFMLSDFRDYTAQNKFCQPLVYYINGPSKYVQMLLVSRDPCFLRNLRMKLHVSLLLRLMITHFYLSRKHSSYMCSQTCKEEIMKNKLALWTSLYLPLPIYYTVEFTSLTCKSYCTTVHFKQRTESRACNFLELVRTFLL